jgi:hypothetical protein
LDLAGELDAGARAVTRWMRVSITILLLVVSCGGSAGTGVPAASPTAEVSPAFDQVLSASKTGEYKVTYKLTATGQGAVISGEQSWYFKQGKARFDLTSTVAGQTSSMSLFAVPDGTFICLGTGAQAQCTGVSGLETVLQQNPAAFYQASMTAHPERFTGVAVGTRHIVDQHAHCYEVHPVAASSELSGSRFCFSVQGVLLSTRFSAPSGRQWSMEATFVSMWVPDSDFALPAHSTILGRS